MTQPLLDVADVVSTVMDGHGSKLEKIGPSFSRLNNMSAKITKTFITLPGEQFFAMTFTQI